MPTGAAKQLNEHCSQQVLDGNAGYLEGRKQSWLTKQAWRRMSFNNGGHHLDALLTAQTVRVQAASMGGYTICFCCCSPYYPLYLPNKIQA